MSSEFLDWEAIANSLNFDSEEEEEESGPEGGTGEFKERGKVLEVQNVKYLTMGVEIKKDGVTFHAETEKMTSPFSDVRANLQILHPFHNIIYYEILVTKAPENVSSNCIGIGFAKKYYYEGMTGWYYNTIGLHADDGNIFYNEGGKHFPTCHRIMKPLGIGEIMGTCWNKKTGAIRFTRNGKELDLLGETFSRDFEGKHKDFLPTISLRFSKGIEFQVLLGGKCKWKRFLASQEWEFSDKDTKERLQIVFDCDERYFGDLEKLRENNEVVELKGSSFNVLIFRSVFV